MCTRIFILVLSAMLLEGVFSLFEVERIHDLYVDPKYINVGNFKMLVKTRDANRPFNKIYLKLDIVKNISNKIRFETKVFKVLASDVLFELANYDSMVCDPDTNLDLLPFYIGELVTAHGIRKAKYSFDNAGTVPFQQIVKEYFADDDDGYLVNTNTLSVDNNVFLRYNVTVKYTSSESSL